jgi:hypothetical protein
MEEHQIIADTLLNHLNEQKILTGYLMDGIKLASELSKQLITLAISIFTFTVTFTKDRLPELSRRGKLTIGFSWVFYIISIFAGIFHMMALTGLFTKENIGQYYFVIQQNAKVAFMAQILIFLVATILMLIYGMSTLKSNSNKRSSAKKAKPPQDKV